MWFRALAILLLLPVAAGFTSFEDANGDVRMATSDDRLGTRATGGQWPNLDIRAGGILEEDDDWIVFFLNVTDLEPQQDPPTPKSQPRYEYFFRYGLQGYRLTAITDLESPDSAVLGAPEARGEIAIEYQEGVYHPLGAIEIELDHGAEQIRFKVDRRLIRDHNEAPLGKNEVLHDMMATSKAMGWGGIPTPPIGNFGVEAGPPSFRDDAPDRGAKGTEYRTQAGRSLHGGNLIASSADPVRWTNGEATTFVYFVRLENTGSRDLEVLLGHEGADPKWEIAYSDRMTVPADMAINATFHVAIPFGHAHGKLHDFDVTFKTETGAHWATQPLAVYWPNIPQPAGHHDTIWMHSRLEQREPPLESIGDRVHGWWSAADENTEAYDERVDMPAQNIATLEDGRSQATWTMRLEPSLRMGLDFLLDQSAAGTVDMLFPTAVVDPQLTLQVAHLDTTTIIPRETHIFTHTMSKSGQVEGAVSFELVDVRPDPAADLIRHRARAELEFRFTLTGTFAGAGDDNPPELTPLIRPTSTMRLPLQEYHDPLETVFFTDASAQIIVGEGGQEKKVNPGKQVVFTMQLDYKGTLANQFRVELSGPHSEWASVLGSDVFEVEPGELREVAISIQPPPTAGRGDYAEVAVKVVSTRNAAVQAGMIVRAVVETGSDIADEASLAASKAQQLQDPEDDSRVIWPWFVFPPLIIVVAGVVWWLRPWERFR